MVIVHLKNPNTGEEKDVYIDGWLKKRLDDKVIPSMGKLKEDFVMIIDGKERYGKSTLAQQLGAYVDPTLIGDLSKICITNDEVRDKITSSRKCCVIYDEAGRGMSAKKVLSEINTLLSNMMQEMGQRNLFLIIVLPTFFELQKYQALFRARVLLHTYKNKSRKGFWRLISGHDKTTLYLKGKKDYSYKYVKSKRRGRFMPGYMVDEDDYEDKKSKAFKEFGMPKEKITKSWVHKSALLYIMNKELKISQTKISEMLRSHNIPLQQNSISDNIARYKEKFIADQEKPT